MHIRHQFHFPTKYTIRQDDKDWTLQEIEEERDIITTADFKVSRQCTKAASKANEVLRMVSRQLDLDKEGS